MGSKQPIFRTYHSGVIAADPVAMWDLGRDAARTAQNDGHGAAYRDLAIPKLYFWPRETTPSETRAYIERHAIAAEEFSGSSHWPMLDIPERTASVAQSFFAKAIGDAR